MIRILLIEEGNKFLTVDLLQRTLLAIVHHCEVLVIIDEVVQREWSVHTYTRSSYVTLIGVHEMHG